MKTNSQYCGIHKVKKTETVWIDGLWSIDVPEKYTYCADKSRSGFFTAESFRDDGKSMSIPCFQPTKLIVSDGATFYLQVLNKGITLDGNFSDTTEIFDDDAFQQMGMKTLISTPECSIGYSKDQFILLVSGVNCAYVGQITAVSTWYCKDPLEKVISLLKSVKIHAVSVDNRYPRLMTELQSACSFEIGEYLDVTSNIQIPIFKGFHYKKNATCHDGRNRALVVVPNNYSFEDDPMEATVGLSANIIPFDLDFSSQDTSSLIHVLQGSNLFSDEIEVISIRKKKTVCLLSQINAWGDGWRKATYAIFAEKQTVLGQLIVNYNSNTDSGEVEHDLMQLLLAFLGNVKA